MSSIKYIPFRLFSTKTKEQLKVKPLNKILIANRGEIACRVIRTAKKMGVRTVAVFSDVDKNSLHVEMADEAHYIGKPLASDSYLNKSKLIEAAHKSNAEAIHPGYGFLSENVEFAELCAKNNITFIGPSPTAIRDMGIKSTAKQIMENAGVPTVPGYHGASQIEDELFQRAREIGFPIMIKAIRGGGGKGMRVAMNESDFIEQLQSAKRESMKSFGDDNVLLERFVTRPRHVEVQVFGDTHKNYVHLFERDCSVQRRHQKIIEEAPAPGITPEMRSKLGETAVKAAAAVDYVGAGTVEFIYDEKDHKFYFMEMNTRLQVEHPVTELITGTDLVEWQLLVAAGYPLPLTQTELESPRGHAFEARLYAEDTTAGFLPGAGRVKYFRTGLTNQLVDDVRVETGIRDGDEVSVHYDPMIAKLVVWDKDRSRALTKLKDQLRQVNIVGLKTNVDFLLSLANNVNFESGNVYTDFIEDHREQLFESLTQVPKSVVVLSAAFTQLINENFIYDGFRVNGIGFAEEKINLKISDKDYVVKFKKTANFTDDFTTSINGVDTGVVTLKWDRTSNQVSCACHDKVVKHKVYYDCDCVSVFANDTQFDFEVTKPCFITDGQTNTSDVSGQVCSPMPGVVESVAVAAGDEVTANQPLITIIAMKMEFVVRAPRNAKVKSILFKAGDNVAKGAQLISFEDE